MTRREALPLLALAAILVITAAWWALALWPLPADSPDWLQRTRLVCFGAAHDSLPSAAGWSVLLGEPLAMLGVLLVVWGPDVRAGLVALGRSWPGRITLAATPFLLVVGLGAAAGRVYAATRGTPFDPTVPSADNVPTLDAPAPSLHGLVDQRGAPVTLARFAGRPLVVTFAYAHCTTVCPVIVHDVIEAGAPWRRGTVTPDERGTGGLRDRGTERPAVLVVTLDPWRDTPTRLPAMAAAWGLDTIPDAFVASGDTLAVARVLDAWGVPRGRDLATGDIVHPAIAVLVDARGRIRYRAGTGADVLATLLDRL